MINSTSKNLAKQTVELTINIPWDDIKEKYNIILTQVSKEAEVPGFRKGKAPKKLVEENVDKTKVYQEVIKQIVPKVYAEEVARHKLTPIISPKIEVVKAKENEEWVIKAVISLKPIINLKNYKNKIKELKIAKVKIWTPGQEQQGKKEEDAKKLTLDEIINALLSEVEIELSDELITQEANRLLSDLIDQTKQLGLTIEQYLISKGKTNDQIRAEYAQNARKNLTVEFSLAEIADSEKITVSKDDIEAVLNKIEKAEDKEKLRKDSYYLAHLIRQQKTLDFLSNL